MLESRALPLDVLSILNSIPGNHLILLPDAHAFTIVSATDAYLKLTQAERELIVGRSFLEIFPENAGINDLDVKRSLTNSLSYVVKHKLEYIMENLHYVLLNHSNGLYENKNLRLVNKPVLDAQGSLQYIIHTAEDITDNEQFFKSEEKIKGLEKAYDLFMSVPAVIGITKGKDHVLELANEAALKLWGKESNIIGQPLSKTIPELKAQGVFELFDKVLETSKPYFANEVPITTLRSGAEELRYFDLVYQPYFNDDSSKATGVFTLLHDVTEMVRAKRELEEAKRDAEKQKRLYETINAATLDLVYVFDKNYRFTYANKALLDMWGSTWEQSIGKGLLENGYEPWHVEIHEREIDEVISNKKPIRGEVSFPHATLGKRVYDYIFVPVLNESGEVEAVAGTTRDISDIRKADQNIRESEERFRDLANNSPLFVFMIDFGPTAPVSFWNKTWLEYTGQTAKEAIGRAWDGIIHPDDVAIVMEHYIPAFTNRNSYFIESVRVKRYDGEYRWHAFKGNPRYSSTGEFEGYVGVGFDIHEQKLNEEIIKQSEAQLQVKVAERTLELENQKSLFDNILKNSSNGISVTEMIRDEEGNVIDATTILANDAAVKFIGLSKEVYLSKTATELDPNIINSPYGQSCLKTLATGDASISQYYMEITGRWQELTISKMDDEHLIHIFTDITPIKQAQLQLERTVDELKRSNTNLEEFAYAASHDLKEPIRKIRTFSDRLKNNLNENLSDENQHYFNRMEKASERMQSLIDDLLEYSHVSNSTNYSEDIDLNKKVTLVLEDLELEVARKNAKVIVGTLPIIKGHRRQLSQLFQNLITNALKFSKPDISPEIRISARVISNENLELFNLQEDPENKLYHLVEISDNGIGFDQTYADKIFKMFQRLHGKTEYDGTGIGLAIVRKVVENHKGFIRAESQPGEGATFKILFPIN